MTCHRLGSSVVQRGTYSAGLDARDQIVMTLTTPDRRWHGWNPEGFAADWSGWCLATYRWAWWGACIRCARGPPSQPSEWSSAFRGTKRDMAPACPACNFRACRGGVTCPVPNSKLGARWRERPGHHAAPKRSNVSDAFRKRPPERIPRSTRSRAGGYNPQRRTLRPTDGRCKNTRLMGGVTLHSHSQREAGPGRDACVGRRSEKACRFVRRGGWSQRLALWEPARMMWFERTDAQYTERGQ